MPDGRASARPEASISNGRSPSPTRISVRDVRTITNARRATCLRPTASGLNRTSPSLSDRLRDRCRWAALGGTSSRVSSPQWLWRCAPSVPPVSAAALGSRPPSCTAGLAAFPAEVLCPRWVGPAGRRVSHSSHLGVALTPPSQRRCRIRSRRAAHRGHRADDQEPSKRGLTQGPHSGLCPRLPGRCSQPAG